MSRHVVVTGMGAVTPLGTTLPASWSALLGGADGEATVELFNTAGCRGHRAAMAKIPDLPGIPAKRLSRFSRATRLALPAAQEALAMAGLLDAAGTSIESALPLVVSTTAGGMGLSECFFRDVLAHRRLHLLANIGRYLPQQQVLDLQQTLGFAGHSLIVANACASGANAVGHAADMIRSGMSDCVLAGGFEALTELVFVGFDCLQATTTEKCRPFDVNRTGLMLGEASAFLVLESPDHAEARGAKPLCRLTGYGHNTDYFHLTQPQPEGKALLAAMEEARRQAGIAPGEIGYLNAHGTATPINDAAETRAFQAFFGAGLPDARISSTKAAIGHTLGAAGSIEAVFTIQALVTGEVPAQLNLQTPIPELAEALVLKPHRVPDLRHAMNVNLGFGGSNAALLFSRHEN